MIELNPNGGTSTEVTFHVPAASGAQQACVVGDFNDWSTTAHPMQADDDGLSTTLALEPGRTYRFRYLLDGERWENDWAAHGYVPNEFGGDDSLPDLTCVSLSSAPESRADGDPAGPSEQAPSRRSRSRSTKKASSSG